MKIGCHVSIAGGVFNAPSNAAELGCEVFQIFSRSPRGGPAPKLTPEIVTQFQAGMKQYQMSECVVHTPYYINFGSKNKAIAQASARIVREELQRATTLSASFVMTHIGSTKDLGRQLAYEQLISSLEHIMNGYQGSAQLLLEISAAAGQIMCGAFEDVALVLDSSKLKKYDIGVCFDTCHAFAAGYDLRTPRAVNETFKKFDSIIGLERIKVLHLNDSKFDLGENRDRHEHIGLGKIGKAGFEAIINHPKLKKINGYLETEHDLVAGDIKILKGMR